MSSEFGTPPAVFKRDKKLYLAQQLLLALRTFEVKLDDGTTEIITAHRHEKSHAGDIDFVTIDENEKTWVYDSFAHGTWKRVKELNRERHQNFQRMVF